MSDDVIDDDNSQLIKETCGGVVVCGSYGSKNRPTRAREEFRRYLPSDDVTRTKSRVINENDRRRGKSKRLEFNMMDSNQ